MRSNETLHLKETIMLTLVIVDSQCVDGHSRRQQQESQNLYPENVVAKKKRKHSNRKIKWGESSRWLFRRDFAWGSIETTTFAKTTFQYHRF